MPPPPVVGSKTIPGASEVWFPVPEENDWLLLCEELPPGVFPVGASCCGDHERAYFDRVRLRGAFFFFEEEVFTFLHKLRLEQGGVPKGRVCEFLASRFP